MTDIEIIYLLIGIICFVFIIIIGDAWGYWKPLLRSLGGKEIVVSEKILGSTANPCFYRGTKIFGNVEWVADYGDKVEIKVVNDEDTEIVEKEKIIPINIAHSLAHSDTDEWYHIDTIKTSDVLDKLEFEKQINKEKAKRISLYIDRLERENADLRQDYKKKIEQDAKTVSHVRGLSGGGGFGMGLFSPYIYGLRRPYTPLTFGGGLGASETGGGETE